MLEVRRLAALVCVAKTGSLTAAARELGVTQPAIGQQLRALESQCGTSLVVRSGRGVRLTTAGSILASRAAPILVALASAEEEIAALRRGDTGRVRIAAIRGAFEVLLTPALSRAKRSEAGLETILSELRWNGHIHEIEALLRGDHDLAICIEGMEGLGRPDLTSREIVAVEPMVVVPVHHPLASANAIRPVHLVNTDLVLVDDVVPVLSGPAFAELHTGDNQGTIVTDTAAAISMVVNDLGIAVVPFVQAVEADVRLVALPFEDPIPVRYLAVTRLNYEPSKATLATLAALDEVAAELVAATEH
jgi:DNA-binding transcriptional LysR family regulator